MGWTEYKATNFYPNGTVNRKAECDAYFLESLNRGWYEVVKSAMVGSTYYAAVKPLKRYNRDSGVEIEEMIPEEERKVHAVVMLTSVSNKSWFSYKPMSESMGPHRYDCPKSILDVLSPTDSHWALEWRQKCRENAERPNLGKLPIGTRIKLPPRDGQDMILVKHAPAYQFKTPFWMIEGEGKYYSKKRIGEFEII